MALIFILYPPIGLFQGVIVRQVITAIFHLGQITLQLPAAVRNQLRLDNRPQRPYQHTRQLRL